MVELNGAEDLPLLNFIPIWISALLLAIRNYFKSTENICIERVCTEYSLGRFRSKVGCGSYCAPRFSSVSTDRSQESSLQILFSEQLLTILTLHSTLKKQNRN